MASVQDLNQIPDGTVKLIFASNVFEQLTQSQLEEMLKSLHPKLENESKLVTVQPNFKYAYKKYFDDYPHIAQSACTFQLSLPIQNKQLATSLYYRGSAEVHLPY